MRSLVPARQIPLGDGQAGCPPVLVMVASHSRFITAVMLQSRTTPDLLAGMWFLPEHQLETVPHRLIWDNEAGVGRRNHLATGVTEFDGALATKIVQLKPFDPKSKSIAERANHFFQTSFTSRRTSRHDSMLIAPSSTTLRAGKRNRNKHSTQDLE